MEQKKEIQDQLETQGGMIRTETIRKSIIVIAVMFGVIAAFSQLFSEAKPQEIANARKNNVDQREKREYTRDEIVSLLDGYLIKKNVPSEVFEKEGKLLLADYNVNAENAKLALQKLNSVKAEHKFRGFANFNIFLANIGPSIFGCIMSILVYLFYLFLKREKYLASSKALKFVSQAMFITFFTYLVWALYPKSDLNRIVYMLSLLILSYYAFRGLKYILNKNFFTIPNIQAHKLRNAVSYLFEVLIIEVNDKFISENQKKEFINFYDDKITKVHKVVK